MKKIVCLLCVFCLLTGCTKTEAPQEEAPIKVIEAVPIEDEARFATETTVDKAFATAAMDRAVEKLRKNIDKFSASFPQPYSVDDTYVTDSDINWTSGMLTGCYWLAYEYTGDEVFKEAALRHTEIYKSYAKSKEKLNDHDTGFIYIPSCIAGYKITGDTSLRDAALHAANILLTHYDWENHFIIRSGMRDTKNYDGYRMLVDSMMNIPLFFFAYEETGDKTYYDAAVGHYNATKQYLIRKDGSSFHHYQFDPKTGDPVYGLTHQGHSDVSCWSRGQAWLIYGYPIAYSYTQDESILPVAKSVTNYYLNRLTPNNVPYWDLAFTFGRSEPKDTSAAAITTCGMLEMCKFLPDDAPEKAFYQNAAAMQLNSMVEIYESPEGADGLLRKVTHSVPHDQGIEEYGIYGDYFYMEALMRYINPEWNRYW